MSCGVWRAGEREGENGANTWEIPYLRSERAAGASWRQTCAGRGPGSGPGEAGRRADASAAAFPVAFAPSCPSCVPPQFPRASAKPTRWSPWRRPSRRTTIACPRTRPNRARGEGNLLVSAPPASLPPLALGNRAPGAPPNVRRKPASSLKREHHRNIIKEEERKERKGKERERRAASLNSAVSSAKTRERTSDFPEPEGPIMNTLLVCRGVRGGVRASVRRGSERHNLAGRVSRTNGREEGKRGKVGSGGRACCCPRSSRPCGGTRGAGCGRSRRGQGTDRRISSFALGAEQHGRRREETRAKRARTCGSAPARR